MESGTALEADEVQDHRAEVRAQNQEQMVKITTQKRPYPINSLKMSLGDERPPPMSFNDFMLINPQFTQISSLTPKLHGYNQRL